MAFQPETPTWELGIYQFETTDFVEGGVGGTDNQPLLQLANRTAWLKQKTDLLIAQRINRPQAARNTVLRGEVTAGLETYFQYVSGTTVKVSASGDPVIFTASKGFDLEGEVVYNVQITSDRTLIDSGPSNGTRYAFLRYDPIAATVILDIADRLVVSADVPTGTDRILWYNPITATFDYNDGSFWATNICAVPVGEYTVTAGVVQSAGMVKYPLRSEVYSEKTQPGVVQMFAFSGVPRGGWLFCNGAAVSRAQYARLFAAIGTTFGAGNGTTTFNLPDLRGRFIRGWNADGSLDAGRVFGSNQADELESHSHGFATVNYNLAAGSDFTLSLSTSGGGGAFPTGATGGNETRPANTALAPYIKF